MWGVHGSMNLENSEKIIRMSSLRTANLQDGGILPVSCNETSSMGGYQGLCRTLTCFLEFF